MAKLPHLPLERLEKTLDRRRVPAPVAPPARESAGAHAASITSQIDAVTKDQQALPKIEGIDPELILKVRLSAPIQEDTWRTAGFKVLAQEPGGILVLFSDDTELKAFRERLAEYQKGVQGDAKNPAYNQLFAAIDDVRNLSASDRIGFRLRADGNQLLRILTRGQISLPMSNFGTRPPNLIAKSACKGLSIMSKLREGRSCLAM
jgi:hypothetical protein